MAARPRRPVRAPKAKPKAKSPPPARPAEPPPEADAGATPEAGRSSPGDFPIVGLGASAGGLEALEEFFRHVPADCGLAFVVVTHQHPGHTSLLPELLGKSAALPVEHAADGREVAPNHVYVAQGNEPLTLLHGRLRIAGDPPQATPRLPIDAFFRSLADDQQERAICIILSGTGTDGTLGLRAVKGAGGMAMVQQPQSARYSGMPDSAVATGLADYVLPPAAMPAQLAAYAHGVRHKKKAPAARGALLEPEILGQICALLRNHTGHDFSAYKPNTLCRRIERRMNVHQVARPAAYIRYLQQNPQELDILFQELLISVTSFFRDPEAFAFLCDKALPDLLKTRPDNHTFRGWVIGCATGEEAYSLAICVQECIDRSGRPQDLQLFASDLDRHAIESARAGRYSAGIAADISTPRLQQHFLPDGDFYTVRKELREKVIFAPQNVIKDPPFTRLDLISCRNLLIYLDGEIQKKLLPLFHYALQPGGLMLLGSSESIGGFSDLFEPLDKKNKVYRRKEAAYFPHPLAAFPLAAAALPTPTRGGTAAPSDAAAQTARNRTGALIERWLLGHFAPASVVVNEQGDILYIHGRTGLFLEPAAGQAKMNLLEMARHGLQMPLSLALREAAGGSAEAFREGLSVRTNGHTLRVDLAVARLQEPDSLRGLLVVSFLPTRATPARARGRAAKDKPAPAQMAQLTRELRETRASLQSTVEELETSNEELKSTNEELQSTNEELQSSNEELETSKEELQSLNEELTTVNAELCTKIEELARSNDDMQNLLNSTSIATVFLDEHLNIQRYTEQAKKLISMIASDVGRPLTDLAVEFSGVELVEDCRAVLRTLVPVEREVRTRAGAWYFLRIIPYRTAENRIAGLVLTFVDVRRLKQTEQTLFENVVETIPAPLVVLDEHLRVVTTNRAFDRTLDLRSRDAQDIPFFELAGGSWDLPALRLLLEELLPAKSTIEGYAVDLRLPGRGYRRFRLNARRLRRAPGLPEMILLAMEEEGEGDRAAPAGVAEAHAAESAAPAGEKKPGGGGEAGKKSEPPGGRKGVPGSGNGDGGLEEKDSGSAKKGKESGEKSRASGAAPQAAGGEAWPSGGMDFRLQPAPEEARDDPAAD